MALHATSRTLLFLLAGCILTGSLSEYAAVGSGDDFNRVPIPVTPLTSADPLNFAGASDGRSWTNDRHPPMKTDQFGRFLYLPSKDTQPYVSFFSISGRSCGYLYAESVAHLPRTGGNIRLSADTTVTFSVVQVKERGGPVVGKGLVGGRLYAYICTTDGQYHRMSSGAGRWTYDVWKRAETGLPTYVDTGVVAAPHFIAVPGGSGPLDVPSEIDPCADRSDWRSMDHHLTCSDYRKDGRERNWCLDMGYIDPTTVDPRAKTGNIHWDVPAYIGCPTACRVCTSCTLNATLPSTAELVKKYREEGVEIDGCKVGYDCKNLINAPLMELGELILTELDLKIREDPLFKPNYVPLPEFNPTLTKYFQELKYTCKFTPANGTSHGEERLLVDLESGTTFEERFLFRVFSATPHALVRYTLDGSDPSYDHGTLVMSGDVVELRRSARVKAVAYLDPASFISIRQSRIAMLPMIRIRIAAPTVAVMNVGHYRRAWGHVQVPCEAESNWVSSLMYPDFEYVRSNGCPRSEWTSANPLNVARHQAWSFSIPLSPKLAFTALAVSRSHGVIGVARNGIPIFAPPARADDPGFLMEMQEVDACGGLSMSIRYRCDAVPEGGQPECLIDTDHHGQYHYRLLPVCLDDGPEDEHSSLLGMMLDGIPIYGARDVGGQRPNDLDTCGGHVDEGRPWYHYHASAEYPYTVGCLSGCIDSHAVQSLNPELAAEAGGSCEPAETQANFAGVRAVMPWVTSPLVSEAGLLLSGAYQGSVSVVATCPMHPGGLSFVRFTTDGKVPNVGGGEGEGFGLGSARIIVSNSTVVKARCEAPDMEPSGVTDTGDIHVQNVAYNPHWAATVGFWNLTDADSFFGSFHRPRQVIQGGCPEIEATHISPAYVKDLAGELGDMLFMPPDCKAGRPEWDVGEQQPSLYSVYGEQSGLPGVLLGTNLAVRGLQATSATVQELVDGKKLPQEELSVEVWATLMGGKEGAFAGIIFKASGFLGKGWYLGWEADTSAAVPMQHTVTFSLTLSTEGNDVYGRGGVATVRATLPKLLIAQHWFHIGGTYDGRQLSLYVNGTLVGTERACRREYCGRITYPVRDDAYVTSDLHLSIGALEYNGRQLRHQGYIGLVRVMGQSVGEEEMRAGAQRLDLPLARSWCPPGTHGPYDGLSPCLPCAPGSQAPLDGQTQCASCPRGFFADAPGSQYCRQCPGGVLTREEGSTSEANCTGPDFCLSLLHNCHTFAACHSTEGSFECTCLSGFQGDGLDCRPRCGDGIRVQAGGMHDEECDDGNILPGDGCSPACRVEEGFACVSQQYGPDVCSCELDAAECCVRAYSLCMVSTSDDCAADCLTNLTTCVRLAKARPTSESTPSGYLDASLWSQVAPEQCKPALMKQCREQLVSCQNDVRQEEAHARLKAALGTGGEGQAGAVEQRGQCSSTPCLNSFVYCMRETACPRPNP